MSALKLAEGQNDWIIQSALMVARLSVKMLRFPDRAFGIDVYDCAGKKRQGVLQCAMGRPSDLVGFRNRQIGIYCDIQFGI